MARDEGIKALFEPRSVALVGSSKLRERVGMTAPWLFKSVIHNMKKYFRGKVYVIDIHGKTSRLSTVKDLPGKPDLGVLMLSPPLSIKKAQELSEAGVKALLGITGGYKAEEREQLLHIGREHGVRFLGPNTILGVVNTTNGLNTMFEQDLMPMKGKISIISQSGGIGAAMIDWVCFYGIGLSKFAFTGDKIDVDDIDIISYYGEDPDTNAMAIYMEGLREGKEFVNAVREVVKEKPVVALKGGITQEAARRALSHTASIAGVDAIYSAAFKKAGVIRVSYGIDHLFDAVLALSKQPPMKGDRVAIISNVGGPAILAADAVYRYGLKLAKLSDETVARLARKYPEVDATNPIDMIADAKAERYRDVLELVLADPNVDGVLVINMLKSCFFEPEDAEVIAEVAKKHSDKPVVDVPTGAEDYLLIQKALRQTDIPTFNLPDMAARALNWLREYDAIRKRIHNKENVEPRDSRKPRTYTKNS